MRDFALYDAALQRAVSGIHCFPVVHICSAVDSGRRGYWAGES